MTAPVKKSSGGGKNLENFITGLGKIALGIGKICWQGFSRTLFKKVEGFFLLVILFAVPFALVYRN